MKKEKTNIEDKLTSNKKEYKNCNKKPLENKNKIGNIDINIKKVTEKTIPRKHWEGNKKCLDAECRNEIKIRNIVRMTALHSRLDKGKPVHKEQISKG